MVMVVKHAPLTMNSLVRNLHDLSEQLKIVILYHVYVWLTYSKYGTCTSMIQLIQYLKVAPPMSVIIFPIPFLSVPVLLYDNDLISSL